MAYLISAQQKEIEVFLKEIYLTILENRHSSVQQKTYLLNVLERLCSDPRALVEIYLNYDCDGSALDNMFQRYAFHYGENCVHELTLEQDHRAPCENCDQPRPNHRRTTQSLCRADAKGKSYYPPRAIGSAPIAFHGFHWRSSRANRAHIPPRVPAQEAVP